MVTPIVQPFIDMDLKVLPDAIAWTAKDEHMSSLLHQFVQDTSIFLDAGKPENKPISKSDNILVV